MHFYVKYYFQKKFSPGLILAKSRIQRYLLTMGDVCTGCLQKKNYLKIYFYYCCVEIFHLWLGQMSSSPWNPATCNISVCKAKTCWICVCTKKHSRAFARFFQPISLLCLWQSTGNFKPQPGYFWKLQPCKKRVFINGNLHIILIIGFATTASPPTYME